LKQISRYISEGSKIKSITIDDNTSRTIQLLSLLSKPDALKIFMTAKDGIVSTTSTPSRMGLTKKQYYSRLGLLVLSGLLIKQDNVYNHTVFGNIIYRNYMIKLIKEVKNSKFLEMVQIIQQSPKFSKDDVAEISFKARKSWTDHARFEK